MVILAFSGVLGSLMQTLIIPVLAQLPDLLDTSVAGASWVVTATLLTGAVITPISGRLGDLYGRRRVLMICVACLLLGSIICALSSDLRVLIVGRALQGMATSVIPLGMSIIRDMIEPSRLPGAIATVSAAAGVGGSIGLPIAAVVAEHFDWHLLFWGSAVVAVTSLALIGGVVPADDAQKLPGKAVFDYIGAVLLAAMLISALTALTMATTWGWSDPIILGMFAAAAIVLIIFYLYERRTAQPLVNMTLFLSRSIFSLNVVTIFTGFGMLAMILILTRLMQAPPTSGYGLGMSITATGLCLAPGGVIMLLCPRVAARIATRRGSKVPLVIGVTVMACSYLVAAVIPFTVAAAVIAVSVNAAGVSFVLASTPALIMRSAPPRETAAANGQNSLMRTIGTASSSAVVALILTATATAELGGTPGFPSESGLRIALVVGGIICLAALVTTIVVPRSHGVHLAVTTELPGRTGS